MVFTLNKTPLIKQSIHEIPVLERLPWIPQTVYASFYPPGIHHMAGTSSDMAYQSLANSLLSLDIGDRKHRRILLTSTIKGKSASWIVMNIVNYLCSANQKVLLLDTDFRSPSVHHAFDLPSEQGPQLADLLQRKSRGYWELQRSLIWENSSACFHTVADIPELSLVPNAKPLMFEDIHVSALETVFQEFERVFDWIILDSSPLLLAEETRKLASLTDGIILLADKQSSANEIRKIQAETQKSNISILGLIERGGEFY